MDYVIIIWIVISIIMSFLETWYITNLPDFTSNDLEMDRAESFVVLLLLWPMAGILLLGSIIYHRLSGNSRRKKK